MTGQAKTALDYLSTSARHPIDETPKPTWAKGPDGRHVNISKDDRIDALYADWLADACIHERPAIVRSINSGNQVMYRWYCRDCGCKLSSNIRADAALEQKVFDVDLDSLASRSNLYRSQREGWLTRISEEAAERAQAGNRAEYDDYLRSDAWKRLRSRVMARANNTCEGCLERKAEHVHHLTYEHIGNEFAFELRALCEPCHIRLHHEAGA